MVVKLADFVSYVPVLRLNASIQGPKLDHLCQNVVTFTILGMFCDSCVFDRVVSRNFTSFLHVGTTF